MTSLRTLRPAAAAAGRGYSIVEMAIVLAVIGLLLGASLVPLGARLREARYTDARTDLAEIRSAVVSYAVSNASPGFHWRHNAGGEIRDSGVLAPGRRYLPCPDVDGDGREDRVSSTFISHTLITSSVRSGAGPFLSNTGVWVADLAVEDQFVGTTMTVATDGSTVTLFVREPTGTTTDSSAAGRVRGFPAGTSRTDEILYFEDDNPPRQLALGTGGYGYCTSDFGAVPWTTLGTPPADPWGNRYLYRVDPMFAHSGIGFGPESRSDLMDPLRPLGLSTVTIMDKANAFDATAVSTLAQMEILDAYRLRTTDPITLRLGGPSEIIEIDPYPGLVCTMESATPASVVRQCAWQGLTLATGNLTDAEHLGVGATVALTLVEQNGSGITVVRTYEPGEPIEGMAFVALSTGQNGYGAIQHTGNIVDATTLPASGLLRCNASPGANDGYPEAYNMPGSVCTSAPVTLATAHHHSFMQLPRHETTNYVFDDELVYMSGSQLVGGLLAAGIDLGPVWLPPRAVR